jgi:hypothetical protein
MLTITTTTDSLAAAIWGCPARTLRLRDDNIPASTGPDGVLRYDAGACRGAPVPRLTGDERVVVYLDGTRLVGIDGSQAVVHFFPADGREVEGDVVPV